MPWRKPGERGATRRAILAFAFVISWITSVMPSVGGRQRRAGHAARIVLTRPPLSLAIRQHTSNSRRGASRSAHCSHRELDAKPRRHSPPSPSHSLAHHADRGGLSSRSLPTAVGTHCLRWDAGHSLAITQAVRPLFMVLEGAPRSPSADAVMPRRTMSSMPPRPSCRAGNLKPRACCSSCSAIARRRKAVYATSGAAARAGGLQSMTTHERRRSADLNIRSHSTLRLRRPNARTFLKRAG